MKTGNELIAEFMGHNIPNEYLNGPDLNNKYNTSWDWLMPVVEKIDHLEGVDTVCKGSRFYIKFGKKKFSCHTISKLNSTYRVVVEFIEWYNAEVREGAI